MVMDLIENITTVVPLDLKFRPNDIIEKAVSIAEHYEFNGLPIIFGHEDRDTKFDRRLRNKLKKYSSTKLISIVNNSPHINTSRLRNQAVQAVNTDYILLLDVDIHPEIHLFLKYLDKIKNGEGKFYIFPCLYLSKFGSDKLLNKLQPAEFLRHSFFSFSRREFLHLASPSSITLLSKKDYYDIGGFDERFCGHGYEDFDFLMRLFSLHYDTSTLSGLMENNSCRSPLFVNGFRKHLGKLCFDIILDKDIPLHIFHAKENVINYESDRKANFELFKEKNKNRKFYSINKNDNLIIDFLNHCSEKDVNIDDYSILFDNKPGHIDRYETLKKRFNFLFNR